MKAYWRYWRRYAIRPLLWLWVCCAFLAFFLFCDFLLKISPNGWSVVALISAWGFYAIADAIKERRVHFVTNIHAQTLEAPNSAFTGSVTVNKSAENPTHEL